MPFVKVPGIDREVWIELHEPKGPETPWFVAVGEQVHLTPEQFAAEMANPDSEWDFSFAHETVRSDSRTDAEAMKSQVREFEPLVRKARAARRGVGIGGRRRGGRPENTTFSVAEDLAILATFFIQHGMKRQTAIDQAGDYWINGIRERFEPSKRLIDAAMARIRKGGITNIRLAIEFVRVKHALPELPRPKKSLKKPRIK